MYLQPNKPLLPRRSLKFVSLFCSFVSERNQKLGFLKNPKIHPKGLTEYLIFSPKSTMFDATPTAFAQIITRSSISIP